MTKFTLLVLVGSMFIFTQAQAKASVNVDAMSQCMMSCKGENACLDSCVSNRGLAKDIAQCLIGCGKNVANQSGETSNMDDLKACIRGCADALH